MADFKDDASQLLKGATNSFAIWVKKAVGTPTHYPAIGILYTGGISNASYFILNTATGSTFLQAGGTTTNPSIRVISIPGWWRFEMTATDSFVNTDLFIEFYPAASLDGQTGTPTATGSQTVWNMQLEDGAFSSSDIVTGAAAVTRNADVITVTPPAGTSEIVTTFEDGTTQVVTSIPGTFTIPNGRVAKVKMT